jgi:MFS superfamily sulfate permease-like transporter
MVTGPMAATAALAAAAVGQVVAGNSGLFTALTATLGLTPGALALLAGLARLGFVANFISEPVLKGFIVGLDHHGVDIVGHISGGLPSFGLPHVPSADYLRLAGPAAGVMLIGFAEGLGAAKTYAARDGYEIFPDRELIGLGAANLAAGLSSGMVVNGSLSKTAVNGSAGARTQASGLAVAVLTVVTLLFLTGPSLARSPVAGSGPTLPTIPVTGPSLESPCSGLSPGCSSVTPTTCTT